MPRLEGTNDGCEPTHDACVRARRRQGQFDQAQQARRAGQMPVLSCGGTSHVGAEVGFLVIEELCNPASVCFPSNMFLVCNVSIVLYLYLFPFASPHLQFFPTFSYCCNSTSTCSRQSSDFRGLQSTLPQAAHHRLTASAGILHRLPHRWRPLLHALDCATQRVARIDGRRRE